MPWPDHSEAEEVEAMSAPRQQKPSAACQVEVWGKVTLLSILCKGAPHVAELLSGSASLSGNVDFSRYKNTSVSQITVFDNSQEYLSFCKARLGQIPAFTVPVEFIRLEVDRPKSIVNHFLEVQMHLEHVTPVFDVVRCHGGINLVASSENALHVLLENASSMLKPSGIFYGLMLDSSIAWSKAQNEVIRTDSYGNQSIVIQGKQCKLEIQSGNFQTFGTPYSFSCEGANPHTGFLVNIPELIRAADTVGLDMVDMMNGLEFLEEHRKTYLESLKQLAPALFDQEGRIIRPHLDPLCL